MSIYQFEPTGQITLVPCARMISTSYDWTTIIMGPTGAGKSTFIEALAGPGQSLGISKDQLAGFTQDVSCYTMENAHFTWSVGFSSGIYLIDTPGFSDSKISEMEIMNKLKRFMKDQKLSGVNNILYLTPITDTRVPRSKRRTIKMLQSLLPSDSARGVTIVTTMWDQVANAKARRRAEAHFAQLRDDIWKDIVDKGAQVVRFQNDRTSAIDVLRVTFAATSTTGWAPLLDRPMSGQDPSAPLLYQELLDRIFNSRQEIESLRIDYIQLIADPDPLLKSVVVPQLLEVNLVLAKFLDQLVQFGNPPPGFEGAPRQIICQHLRDHVENARQDLTAFKNARAQARKLDWIRRSIMTIAIRKAESRLSELSTYLDASGNPQVPPGSKGLREVLECLCPKVKTTFTGRVKEEFKLWTRTTKPTPR